MSAFLHKACASAGSLILLGLLRPSCTPGRLAHRRLFWHLSQTPNLLVFWTRLLIQEVDYSLFVFPFRCL